MTRGFLAGVFCLALLAPAALPAQVQVKSKAVELVFSGRLQLQGWSSSCSGFLPLQASASPCRRGAAPFDLFLRRARASVQAQVIDFIDLKLELDFSGFDEVAAKDAWARLNFDPALRVRLGNMKRPFDGFQLASSSKILMIERDIDVPGVSPIKALSLDELTTRFRLSDRDVGIEISGDIAGGRFAYWAGYWAGQQIQEALDTLPNADSRGQWMGRVLARLQVGKMPLDIAVAGAVTDRPFVDSDGFTFTGKYFGDLELWLELGDYDGGFHLQGEYVYGQNPFENKQGDLLDFLPTDDLALAQTWQAVAGYKIVTRPEGYEGPIRKQPIEAIEPIFRVTWADPNIDIDEDDSWGITPGVQIFFYGRNKLALNWDVALFNDGTDAANSFKLMMQAYF